MLDIFVEVRMWNTFWLISYGLLQPWHFLKIRLHIVVNILEMVLFSTPVESYLRLQNQNDQFRVSAFIRCPFPDDFMHTYQRLCHRKRMEIMIKLVIKWFVVLFLCVCVQIEQIIYCELYGAIVISQIMIFFFLSSFHSSYCRRIAISYQ